MSNFAKTIRPSLHNSQLLISTGISSLDDILGGGLPLGSILLVFQDESNVFSQMILKYFISQGISTSSDGVFVGGDESLLSSSYQVYNPTEKREPKTQSKDDALKIAWRYANSAKTENETKESTTYCNSFDLQAPILDRYKQNIDRIYLFEEKSYVKLLHELQRIIHLKYSPPSSIQPLRIVLDDIGSIFWGDYEKNQVDLCRFLVSLKSLLRFSYGAAIISMSSILYQDFKSAMSMCDAIIKVESLPLNSPYKNDYSGLFKLVKAFRLNSLLSPTIRISNSSYSKDTDFGIKCRRKKFSVEVLTLPPSINEQSSKKKNEDW